MHKAFRRCLQNISCTFNLHFVSISSRKVTIAIINPLSANPTNWSNVLKQFVSSLPTNYLSVFDHFVGLALKELMKFTTVGTSK